MQKSYEKKFLCENNFAKSPDTLIEQSILQIMQK